MNRQKGAFCTLTLVVFYTASISTANAQVVENSILWEISGNGLDKPSYLFGILNFLPKEQFTVPKKVGLLIDDCEVFATKNVFNHSTQDELNQAVRIPDDGMINDYLSDNELNQLRILLMVELGVREHSYHFEYSRLQPIILVPTLTALYLGKNIVYLEPELAHLAHKSRLEFVGLGTTQEEIDAFKEFPIQDQVEALKYTVNNFDEHIEDYNQMVQNYLEDQDLAKIKDEILKATNRSQTFQEVYYDSRNKAWVKVIEELVNKKPTFIAVGAVHLEGESGLIELLRKEAYTIKPINAFE